MTAEDARAAGVLPRCGLKQPDGDRFYADRVHVAEPFDGLQHTPRKVRGYQLDPYVLTGLPLAEVIDLDERGDALYHPNRLVFQMRVHASNEVAPKLAWRASANDAEEILSSSLVAHSCKGVWRPPGGLVE